MAMASGDLPCTTPAVRRLTHEAGLCHRWQHPNIVVRPAPGNMLEMHFVLHNLPSSTYQAGCYHGKLVFPPDYPWQPPAIRMLTESGRFYINRDICTSASNWHKENWNPDWNAMTILIGFLSLFLDVEDGGVGHICPQAMSNQQRLRLAGDSWRANSDHEFFSDLFPEFQDSTRPSASSQDQAAQGSSLGSCGSVALENAALEEANKRSDLLLGGRSVTYGGMVCEHADNGGPAVQSSSWASLQVPSSAKSCHAVATVLEERAAEPISASSAEDDIHKAAERVVCTDLLPLAPERAISSTSVSSTAGDSNTLLCHFCWEGDQETPFMDPPPCACRGTMGALHHRCLLQWVQHSGNLQCNTCGEKYAGEGLNVERLDSLSESMGLIVSAHAGTQGILIISLFVAAMAWRCITIAFNPSVAGAFGCAYVVGRCAGYWLIRNRTQARVPDGAEMPMLPIAVARLMLGRITNRVEPTQIQDARAARPDIGVGAMLLCAVMFCVASLCLSVEAGLALLLILWLLSAVAAHMARWRAVQHLNIPVGPEQLSVIRVMVGLFAVQSGTCWSLLIAAVVMIGFLQQTVVVALSWTNFTIFVATVAAGVYWGHRLTQDPRDRYPLGADVPLLLEEAAEARVVRRLQVVRAVRGQVVRSLRRDRCAGYSLGSCLFLVALYVWSRSSGLCLTALCTWQLGVNCAGRVVMRRMHAHWYEQMFPADEDGPRAVPQMFDQGFGDAHDHP